MVRLLQRLLDPAYLYAIDPGPLGPWKLIYVAWALALLTGTGLAAWWRSRCQDEDRPVWTIVAAWSCGIGALFLMLRFLSPLARCLPTDARFVLFDVWTARVWPFSATALAGLALGIGLLGGRRLPPALQRHVDALTGTLTQEDTALPLWQNVSLAGVHLLGLACLWRTADLSIAWAVPSLFVLLALPLLTPRHRLRPETLAPLWPSYISSVALAVMGWLGIDTAEYQGFAFPDPWSPWFSLSALVVVGVAYTLWIQIRLTLQRTEAVVRDLVLPLVLSVSLTLWLAITVGIHRTHGVTASDPYCYVQMAIDLAETGSALHDFPLARLAREQGLPTWPTVHVGYQPPVFGDLSPTMWSMGWPLLMVPLYRLGGPDALYFAAPLVSALALVVVWGAVNEALYTQARATRWGVGALTCWLVATSPESAERILVPMADAAAQLFTMLTLWLLMRGRRSKPVLHALLAGASFGEAYFVRHPQLPLGLAALIAVGLVPQARARQTLGHRLGQLAAFGLAAFLITVPDLWYHKTVFGGWLHTESTEWSLISVQNAGHSFFAVLEQGLLRREELGFVAPLVCYGAWLLWRRHRDVALVLGSGFLAVFGFHLCYAALRPRDLIAILPVLYLCAAYGFVCAWRAGQKRRSALAALWLLCCATFLGMRTYRTLAMPWREDVVTFGHISARQRQALDMLRTLTPADAVIGSMLNSGAIELYAGRQAIHPAPWTADELTIWTDGLLGSKRAFYVLDDGEEMETVLAHLGDRYTLRPIQALELPYFAIGGGNLPRVPRLYKVEERDGPKKEPTAISPTGECRERQQEEKETAPRTVRSSERASATRP